MGRRQDKELRRLEEALMESDDTQKAPGFWNNLSEKDAIILYEDLRAALERMLPNNSIDASDCDVLTVFPFRIGTGDIPEDYEVENYETGMVGQYPALRKVGKTEEVYILDGELIPCPSTTYK